MKTKKILIGLALLAVTVPQFVSAHERQLFNVGGTDYLMVVGSLGEPVVVDDKTGVDFRVVVADPADPTNSSASGVKPVTGLESEMKVEIIAGEKKKTFDLTTVFNSPGAYKAIFFPTVKTALSYRLTGMINRTPIDLTFACAPEGVKGVEDKTEVQISAGVRRLYKNGQFGCVVGKEELGFPEEGMSILGLHEKVTKEISASAGHIMMQIPTTKTAAALVLGLLGVILGLIALNKSKRKE